MRKCVCTVFYTKSANDTYKSIKNITVNHRGDLITLLDYNDTDIKPYNYSTFNELYATVLSILKSNNYYTGYCYMFNAYWYDIQWIEVGYSKIEKYGYIPNKPRTTKNPTIFTQKGVSIYAE